MKTDIEIAREAKLLPITEVAAGLNIGPEELVPYGKYKAKVTPRQTPRGKLILVTAINPTSAGEGKTTVSIGLADGLKKTGRKVCLALREPSLGPVFGIKGGAAGGGKAQIAPMEDINLHFTGDLHAITSANNLLAAMTDNHIYWGNKLGIRTVTFHRCMDLNDRALRAVVTGLGGYSTAREDSFDITAASEVMAVLCLASDEADLKKRLGDIVVGQNADGKNVTAADLKAADAMAILLKDAIKPNLVQTLENVPAFVHGGPFANIAHGCNSVIATKAALSYADYAVTEAGFGADLGAEKFLDIKCRAAGLVPDAVVVVATVRALKCAGGKTGPLDLPDPAALEQGLPNLMKHVENITGVYGLPCVVAINRFLSDTTEEIALIESACAARGVKAVCAECWGKGGEGAAELADAVVAAAETSRKTMNFCYELSDPIEEKIRKIATKIYGAGGVKFTDKAKKSLAKLAGTEAEKMPVCVAKTQYSLSDDPTRLGRPSGFDITVRDLSLRAGAGFVVALAGDILLMPGLSRVPNAENMTMDGGIVKGLF